MAVIAHSQKPCHKFDLTLGETSNFCLFTEFVNTVGVRSNFCLKRLFCPVSVSFKPSHGVS